MKHSKRYIILAALTAAIGKFLRGFDASVLPVPVPFIRKCFGLTGVRGDLEPGWGTLPSHGSAAGGDAVVRVVGLPKPETNLGKACAPAS